MPPPAAGRLRTFLFHLAGWVAVLLVTDVLSFQPNIRLRGLLQNPNDLRTVLTWVLLIGGFYLHHYLLIPRYYFGGRRVLYAALLVGSLTVVLLLPEAIVAGTGPPPRGRPPFVGGGRPPPPGGRIEEFGTQVLVFIISLLGSLSYQTQQRLRDAEALALERHLSQLKAQIQPHFLFNTLNSIYALAVRQDERTPDTIVQLSEFLRYLVDQQGSDAPVALRRELDYLENYLSLQRARLRDTVTVDYRVRGDPAGMTIAPLILFTYVENAFKHGVSPEEPSAITIDIDIGERQLQLRVVNRIVAIRHREAGSGIGLENTRQRLQLLYPGRHQLITSKIDETYSVSLTLTP